MESTLRCLVLVAAAKFTGGPSESVVSDEVGSKRPPITLPGTLPWRGRGSWGEGPPTGLPSQSSVKMLQARTHRRSGVECITQRELLLLRSGFTGGYPSQSSGTRLVARARQLCDQRERLGGQRPAAARLRVHWRAIRVGRQ